MKLFTKKKQFKSKQQQLLNSNKNSQLKCPSISHKINQVKKYCGCQQVNNQRSSFGSTQQYQFLFNNYLQIQSEQAQLNQLLRLQVGLYFSRVQASHEMIIQLIRFCLINFNANYTRSLGYLCAQISYHWKQLEQGQQILFQIQSIFPQIFHWNINKKCCQQYVKYGIICLKQNLNNKYSQIDSLEFQIQDRWTKLIFRFLGSIFTQFLPVELGKGFLQNLITKSKKNQSKMNKNSNTSSMQAKISKIHFIYQIMSSLFHFACFSNKEPVNIQHYYNICSCCFMGNIEWPIVISNSTRFQLPKIICSQDLEDQTEDDCI